MRNRAIPNETEAPVPLPGQVAHQVFKPLRLIDGHLIHPRSERAKADLNHRLVSAQKEPGSMRLVVTAADDQAIRLILVQNHLIGDAGFAAIPPGQQQCVLLLRRQTLQFADQMPEKGIVETLDDHTQRSRWRALQ